MKIERLTHTNLADGLAERIVEMIRSGDYEPGDRLPTIMSMARSFGVGHPTVREALKKLEVFGLIDIRHGSGVYVKSGQDILVVSNPVCAGPASKKVLVDLVEARIPIEVKAAGLAAQEATEEQLARMEEYLHQASANLENDEVLSSVNVSFHREISAASGNSVLAQLQEVVANLFQHEQVAILNIYGCRGKDHREHIEILHALRRRDPAQAQQVMQAHLEGVRDALLRWNPDDNPMSG